MRENQDLEGVEEAIRKLKSKYDKYFIGMERIEPLKDRARVKRMVRDLMSATTNNTARRFKIQSINSTLVTYEQYWNRVAKQIEEGTFKRDVERASKLAGQGGKPRHTRKIPQTSRGTDLDTLHAEFISARKTVGDARPVSKQSLEATVRKQTEALKKRYNCKNVEFRVTVKEGRAILKAFPR